MPAGEAELQALLSIARESYYDGRAVPKLMPTSTAIIICLWLTFNRSSSNLILSFSNATIILDPPNWKIPISSPLLISVPTSRNCGWILIRTQQAHSDEARKYGAYSTVPTFVAPIATKSTLPNSFVSIPIQHRAFRVNISIRLLRQMGSTW
jgi:hypothetical protein